MKQERFSIHAYNTEGASRYGDVEHCPFATAFTNTYPEWKDRIMVGTRTIMDKSTSLPIARLSHKFDMEAYDQLQKGETFHTYITFVNEQK